jgi:3-oxoacyl-[acyl-carrier protein] reductase
MFDLQNKKVLITGASGDIGGSIAKLLYSQGSSVVLSGTKINILESLSEELGQKAQVLQCNLKSKEDTKNLVSLATELMGGLDILINNAGMTKDNLLVRMSDEDWHDVIGVNLTSTMYLTRAALKGMMRQKWGRIVNISSVVGVSGNPGQSNYVASKAGIIGMSKAIAQEVASRGITINCIAPGFIESAMTGKLSDDQKSKILSKIPIGRMGSAQEIASTVLYLVSNESSYVTGQTIHINGGMLMV